MAGHCLAGAPVGSEALYYSAIFSGDGWLKSVVCWSLDKKDEEIKSANGQSLDESAVADNFRN
jgi:hypothetical protein